MNKIMKYPLLHSYRNLQFPNEFIAKFSWWQKYKFNRSIIKELPKYCSRTGKTIDWHIFWQKKVFKNYDIFTGKLTSEKTIISYIDIHGYVGNDRACSDRYNYNLCTGKVYYETWLGFSGYGQGHPNFDIDKD